MGTIIRATPEEMEKAASKIESLANDYKARYNRFYSVVDDMQNGWKGADAKAFVERVKGFNDDFTKMYKLMNEYASYLRKVADSYRRAQQQHIDSANRMTN